MKPEFTKEGIETQTFTEVFNQLVQQYKDIYGSDIDLSQNTPDGQKIGIEAKLATDLQEFALSLADSRDPDFAEGNNLNIIAKVCGITRNPATQSSVLVTVTTNEAIVLASGFTIADDNNQNWITKEDLILTQGDNDIEFYSENFGSISALAGTITTIITVIREIVSVTNPDDAVVGVDEETDENFRIRRNLSTENPAYSTLGSLYARLANIENVTDVVAYENNQDTTDPVRDMPPHSIWCIVKDGTNEKIAEVIVKNKTGGTTMKGQVVVEYEENRIRPNGTPITLYHQIKFDRPILKNLYIRLTVEEISIEDPIDIQLIKNKLLTKKYLIGEDAQANSLFCLIYQAGTNFIATDLEISIDEVTWTDKQISANFDDLFIILNENITITETP